MAAPVAVEQGDQIVSGDRSCTVTYVADGWLYTAGHCTQPGEDVYRVRHGLRRHIGVTTTAVDTGAEDYAVVKLNPRTNTHNPHADNLALTLQPGDTVCHYARQTNTTQCGTVDAGGWVNAPHTIRKGDSGGPVWAPGKGLVGSITHTDGPQWWRVSGGGWPTAPEP